MLGRSINIKLIFFLKNVKSQKCSNHKIHNVSFDLYGKKVEPGDKDHNIICFMHGILGTKRNWRTPAQKWRNKFSNFSCLTFDHRGHGSSSNIHKLTSLQHYPLNDIRSCAYDLIQLLQNENLKSPNILVAHSFSGKVALQYIMEINNINEGLTPMERHFDEPAHTWLVDSGTYIIIFYIKYYLLL